MNREWRHTFPLTALFEAPLKIGELRYKALCPSHLETHASCVVNYHRQHGWRWHCFACNADGDALDVLTLRGMSVREALVTLGNQAHSFGGWCSVCGCKCRETAPPSPAPRRRTDPGAIELVCDACRDEHATFAPREYRRSTSTWELEALMAGWELAAGVDACVGPKCLDRIASC